MSNEPEVKRWTTKSEADIEHWVYDALSGMVNARSFRRDLVDSLCGHWSSRIGLHLRSNNGLVFTSRLYTTQATQYGLSQAFIQPHTPQQNDIVGRLIRTIKKQYIWMHNFGWVITSPNSSHVTSHRLIRRCFLFLRLLLDIPSLTQASTSRHDRPASFVFQTAAP